MQISECCLLNCPEDSLDGDMKSSSSLSTWAEHSATSTLLPGTACLAIVILPPGLQSLTFDILYKRYKF